MKIKSSNYTTFLAALVPLSIAAVATFPGLASVDSFVAWNSVTTRTWDAIIPIPYLVLVYASNLIFGSTGFVLVIQVAMMAFAISYGVRTFIANKLFQPLAAFIICLLPSVFMLTSSIWKDSMFVSFYIMLVTFTYKLLQKDRSSNTDNLTLFFLILFAGSFRLNGWILISPIIFIIFWRKRFNYSLLFIASLSFMLSAFTALLLPSALSMPTQLSKANSVASFALDNAIVWTQADVDDVLAPETFRGSTRDDVKSVLKCEAWDSLFSLIRLEPLSENREVVLRIWTKNLTSNPALVISSRICRAAPNVFPYYSPEDFGSIRLSGTGQPMSVYTGQWTSPSEQLGSNRLVPLLTSGYERFWNLSSHPKYYSILWWGGSFLWLSLITFGICIIRRCATSVMKFGILILVSTAFINGLFAVSNDFRYIVPIQILGILVTLNGIESLVKARKT